MKNLSYGKLLNKAGHDRYANPDAPKKVLEYISRTNGMPTDDLVAWGGLGVWEFLGVDIVIDQFYVAQKKHTRKGDFGRYVDHEIFSFSTEAENAINESKLDVDEIARKMAYDIYDYDNCQVAYAVHHRSEIDKYLHIHFVINTVNYITGNKRRENINQTKEREKRFNKIVDDAIKNAKKS